MTLAKNLRGQVFSGQCSPQACMKVVFVTLVVNVNILCGHFMSTHFARTTNYYIEGPNNLQTARTHAHARTHTRAHTHTYTHTHKLFFTLIDVTTMYCVAAYISSCNNLVKCGVYSTGTVVRYGLNGSLSDTMYRGSVVNESRRQNEEKFESINDPPRGKTNNVVSEQV